MSFQLGVADFTLIKTCIMWDRRGPEGVAWKVMGKENLHVLACMEPWPNSLFFSWNQKLVFGYF